MQPFIQRHKRLLQGLVFAFFCLASAEWARADSKVYQDMLHSTGLIEATHADRIVYGTCCLVDDEHKLVLTSQHVVKNAAEVIVYFPVFRDGAVVVELDHYHRNVAAIRGQIVHRDTLRDLALIRLENLPEHVKPMPLAEKSAGPGDTVHSVGNSGVLVGKLWRYTAGNVRSAYQAKILTEEGLLTARILETQSAINEGDSGGPVVNDRGELVGVVKGSRTKSILVSLNVDVSEVKAILAEVRSSTKTKQAMGAESKSQHVHGSWKVTLINLQGEQLSGECRFKDDGTFALTAQASDASEIRRGRYSYANGVLLLAWDRFEVREALHWVKYRRFTLLSDEMLIFDRKPETGAGPKPTLPTLRESAKSHSTAVKVKPNPTAEQPPANLPAPPLPVRSMNSGEGSGPHWALASLLIGAMIVLLLIGIQERHRQRSINNEKNVPVHGNQPSEETSDAAYHGG